MVPKDDPRLIRHPGFFRFLALIAIALPAAPLASAQTSEPPLKFEVADVQKSARPDIGDSAGGLMRRGLYLLRHATMLELIRIAYDVDARKVPEGPNWLELDRFDIRATVPPGTTPAALKPMLQALLADRFGLVVHRDTRPLQAWTLTSGKNPQLRRSDGSGASGEAGCRSKESDDSVSLSCRNTTMAGFSATLRSGDAGIWYYLTDNLVVDRTNLAGAWDFDLKYSARWNTSAAGVRMVSLFDAIDKLGLQLDASTIPTPVLIVDRVNRTPTPNSAATDRAFPPLPTEFEVADIKPAKPDYRGPDGFQPRGGGLVNLRAVTLKWLVAAGWGVTEETIFNAPRFMDSEHWNIAAKVPDDVVTATGEGDFDSLVPMVNTLLRDRFGLAAHFETRPMPALTMVASKPKMKPADPNSRTGCREGPPTLTKIDPRSTNPTAARLLTCTNVTMSYLASHLQFLASGYVHADVLNATGLEGGWDFTLSFSKVRQLGNVASAAGVSEPIDPNGALSVQEAMEKQLGLKLVVRKRPVQVLVIDRIEERPSEN